MSRADSLSWVPHHPLLKLWYCRFRNLTQQRPVATTTAAALWISLALVAPVLTRLSWPGVAADCLHFLVSLDVPLTLALTAILTAQFISRIRSFHLRDPLQWLLPRSQLGPLRFLALAGELCFAVRWPAAAAQSGLLLGWDPRGASPDAREFMTMLALGTVLSLLATWVLSGTPEPRAVHGPRAFASLRGLRALAWAPLQEALHGISLRRLLFAGLPVMLAAPMGVSASEIATLLAFWWLAMSCVLVSAAGIDVAQSLRRWQPVLLPQRMLLRHLLPSVAGYMAAFAVCGPVLVWWTDAGAIPRWAPAAWAALVLAEGTRRMLRDAT